MNTACSDNAPAYSVSELSVALKKTIEDGFSYVRVRGELGRVTKAGSGHIYLDLKDERAVLSGIVWKGAANRLKIQPEQGVEVVATGRLTTFPGQSRYQIVIDTLEPAGVGALMALLEARKKKLTQEGVFDPAGKKALPFLPTVIGVITSPSGAVIRDILHRLRDRFPRQVIVWPTLVQGEKAAAQISAAIDGFNALTPSGTIPRPDLLIVARGGGSLEDLWCFNEESVVRAVAASDIPLISAVGHETDTTLIDFAADQRAPTPTAAAEMAVPVRHELQAEVVHKSRRMIIAQGRLVEQNRLALSAAGRGLGSIERLFSIPVQRLDHASVSLQRGLKLRVERARGSFNQVVRQLRPHILVAPMTTHLQVVQNSAGRLARTMALLLTRRQEQLMATTSRLRMQTPVHFLEGQQDRLHGLWGRLTRSSVRHFETEEAKLKLAATLLHSLSYKNTLARGFALIRDGKGEVIRQAHQAQVGQHAVLTLMDGDRDIQFIPASQNASGNKTTNVQHTKKGSESKKQRRLFE